MLRHGRARVRLVQGCVPVTSHWRKAGGLSWVGPKTPAGIWSVGRLGGHSWPLSQEALGSLGPQVCFSSSGLGQQRLVFTTLSLGGATVLGVPSLLRSSRNLSRRDIIFHQKLIRHALLRMKIGGDHSSFQLAGWQGGTLGLAGG